MAYGSRYIIRFKRRKTNNRNSVSRRRSIYPLVRYQRPMSLTAPVRRVITNYAEKKFKDLSLSDNTITANWEFIGSLFDLITQGTDANSRIGNKIFVTKITVTICVRGQATMAVDGNAVRVVLFKDSATNGRPVTFNDLWSADSLVSVRNGIYSNNISILKDTIKPLHVTALPSTSGTTAAAGAYYSNPQFIKWVIYPKMLVDYDSSTTGIAALLKNNIGIGYCGLASTAAYLSGYTKIEFTDC